MIQRKHKDKLFTKLFGDLDNKENLLSLYNALNDRNYTDIEGLEINTIDDVIYMGRKNDVSCIVDARMNLFEHQSTYNPNMPLRGMIYVAKLYEKYIEQYELNIYSEKLAKIPTPRYFVLYNGTKDMPERMDLKLSDAFVHPDEATGIEEYAIFVDRVRRYVKPNMSPSVIEAAVDRAVDECIKEGVLAGFLSKHTAEVRDMILTDYDEEKTMEMFKREFREDGYSEGLQAGYDKGARDGEQRGYNKGEKNGRQLELQRIALQMKTKGMSDDVIADMLSVTPEQLKEILSDDKVHEL